MRDEISIKGVEMDISIASTVSMRESGLDEYWLQDQIYENPACLGLGDLESVSKEKQQSSGGRLDILLKIQKMTLCMKLRSCLEKQMRVILSER